MAKFKKKVVSPGVWNVGRLNGTQEKDAITSERIKGWVENTQKLRSLGVLIPAPLTHQDKENRFALPLIKAGDGETLADAYSGANKAVPPAWDIASINSGFWEDFQMDEDGSAVCVLEADGDPENVNTAAGKIGKTIKETSILVMPKRTVVDREGKEHEIGEHFGHIAVCLHPQEPGQKNFEPLTPVPDALAMSFILKMDAVGTSGEVSGHGPPGGTGLPGAPVMEQPQDPLLYEVTSLLRSSLGVALPEDVTREDFLPTLKIVLTQKLADQQVTQKEDDLTSVPQGGQVKSPSIAMSQTVQTDTDKNVAFVMNILTQDRKKILRDRALKLASKVGKDWVEKVLLPKIDAFTMSVADLNDKGEYPKSSVEELMEAAEAIKPLHGPSLVDQGLDYSLVPDAAVVEEMPVDAITGAPAQDLSDETVEAIFTDLGI